MNDWYEQLLSSLATKHDEVCTEGAACSARRKHIESAYVIPALRKMIERVREVHRTVLEPGTPIFCCAACGVPVESELCPTVAALDGEATP